MIPREYYHVDKNELSQYIDSSVINERLFEGYLEVKSQYLGGPKVLHPLVLFNEAYYYASKVCIDQYPELDINKEYLDDFMVHHPDELSRDIVFCFVYVILECMQNPPKKVKRFCNLLGQKYDWYNENLNEIASAMNGNTRQRGFSDGWLGTDMIDEPFVDYDEVDWRKATDDFKWYHINRIVEDGYSLRDKIIRLEAINSQFLKFDPMVDNYFTTEVADKIRWKMIGIQSEKDGLRESDPVRYNEIFWDDKVEIEEPMPELPDDLPDAPMPDLSDIPFGLDDEPSNTISTEEYTILANENQALKDKIAEMEAEMEALRTLYNEPNLKNSAFTANQCGIFIYYIYLELGLEYHQKNRSAWSRLAFKVVNKTPKNIYDALKIDFDNPQTKKDLAIVADAVEELFPAIARKMKNDLEE